MSALTACPACRRTVPADAPEGLCPWCLGEASLDPAASAAPDELIDAVAAELAETLPEYEVAGFLGRGGMGLVFLARQMRLDRAVALKVLLPEVSEDPAFRERFTREAHTLAQLNHPGIVAVHDFGRAGSLYYLAMEYVEGANLRDLTTRGRLSPNEALRLIPQVCSALEYAHRSGVVHRDIKPENILVDEDGQVKIADFGLAKLARSETDLGLRLTRTTQAMGTPQYIAPEQLEGAAGVDHRADIFSLGVVFYELLTGQLPSGAFEPPSRLARVSEQVDDVVLRSLQRDPERRYQEASSLRNDVERLRRGEQPLTDPIEVPPPMPKRPRRIGPRKSATQIEPSTRKFQLNPAFVQWAIYASIAFGLTLAYFLSRTDDWEADRMYWRALQTGDRAQFFEYVNEGPWLHDPMELERIDRDGWSPLHVVADKGDAPFIEALLARGSWIDRRGSEDQRTPLQVAVLGGHVSAVEALILNGADVDLADAEGRTATHMAAHNGDPALIDLLATASARFDSPDARGRSPFMEAMSAGQTAVAQQLLQLGVDPTRMDVEGVTPFAIACEAGHLATAAWFVRETEQLIDFDRRSLDGRTPLHRAAAAGKTAIVRFLIEKDAEIDLRDDHGRTPLLDAAANGHTSTASILLDAGADPQQTDLNGAGVLELAARGGAFPLYRLMLAGGATETPVSRFVIAFDHVVSGKPDTADALLEGLEFDRLPSGPLSFKRGDQEYTTEHAGLLARLLSAQAARGANDVQAEEALTNAALQSISDDEIVLYTVRSKSNNLNRSGNLETVTADLRYELERDELVEWYRELSSARRGRSDEPNGPELRVRGKSSNRTPNGAGIYTYNRTVNERVRGVAH